MSQQVGGRVVRVRLDGTISPPADRSYDVVVRPGVLGAASVANELKHASLPGGVVGGGLPSKVFLIVDTGVPKAIVNAVAQTLRSAGANVSQTPINPIEQVKSLGTLESLLVAMTEARLERGDLVVALGGGIVGDVAGFAAAVYRRGVGFVQCPTTLLSMVDASVGGKTGVNIQTPGGLKKNMVGAFHQPRRVLADPLVLVSLPPRQLRAGLGECIKHALLAADFDDPQLGEFLTTNMPKFLACDAAAMTELVARNVAIKARVVEGDEREEAPIVVGTAGKPGRMVLNLGHTFGHALETMPGLTPDGETASAPLHHGEAVALGTLAAVHCSRAIGLVDDALVAKVRQMLELAGLPTKLRAVPGRVGGRGGGLPSPDQIIEAMYDDKKVGGGGKLRLVLPIPGDRCVVVENPPIQAVRASLAGIGA